MSDSKTRDTGVSLTYINNDYIAYQLTSQLGSSNNTARSSRPGQLGSDI